MWAQKIESNSQIRLRLITKVMKQGRSTRVEVQSAKDEVISISLLLTSDFVLRPFDHALGVWNVPVVRTSCSRVMILNV